MKIAIDARAYAWAGIGRCIRNLIKELGRHPASAKHEFLVMTGRENKDEVLVDCPYPNWSLRVVESSYYSWSEQTVFLYQLSKIKADLWHFMHFNMPVFFNKPYIVTVHDITRFVFPGQKRQDLWQQVAYEFAFKRAVERARYVVCVSQTTHDELLRLPLNFKNNIKNISWGVEDIFLKPVSGKDKQKVRMLIDTKDPYILYVGVWMNHKNLPRLLKAFQLILSEKPNLKLVLTGKPKPGYNNMVELSRKLKILDNVIFPGYVPDNLLPALYTEAGCLAFPSLYEGFGFPALEAAACGTPVVTSNASCLPEIMGSAAIYVNPEYVPDIVSGIRKAFSGGQAAGELVNIRKKRARMFDWKEVASEYLDLYELF